jgi:dolichyl-phosphate-mannose-protein mannosyltransferase
MSSTRGSLGAATLRRTDAPLARALALPRRLSLPAWGAIAMVVASIAITGWWLSVNEGVPYNDAAQHLFWSLHVHDLISSGKPEQVFDFRSFYPPATFLLGAAATYVGGVTVAAPILAQNLVYVPLLALACFQIGRMLGGPRAGLLAVAFALGSPLVIEQFHVFMLDAPQAALVAVAAWLILASERFSRTGIAALAGLAVGVGIESKQLVPLYLAGLVACVLARGGWRNWRGFAVFAALALLVGSPWYVRQLALGHTEMLHAASIGGDASAIAEGAAYPPARPPLFSSDNALWYFWATLDGLLFAPLFAFAAIGVGAAVTRVARARPRHDLTLELLCGLGGAWLALTVMPHKDMRYTLGLIIFLAVLGTVWLVRLSPGRRRVATSLLVLAIVAAHVGATFGVGPETSRQLPGARRADFGEGVPPRDRVIVYENHDYMVSGPVRHADVPGLFQALKRVGVVGVAWVDRVEPWDKNFEDTGLWVLARVANLPVLAQGGQLDRPGPGQALLVRAQGSTDLGSPCLRLADGSGVWVLLGTGNPKHPQQPFCPRL